MTKQNNVLGMRFNRLLVVEHIGCRTKNRNHYWKAVCNCGNEVFATAYSMLKGSVKSCGCWQRESAKAAGDRTRTHGMSSTPIYAIWDSMIQRCYNQKRRDFKSYGAKGITVCDKWKSDFLAFFNDMGHRPNGMSLDRINTEKEYSPDNCRWATARQQSRNRSVNRMITYEGKTMCLQDLADEVCINKITLQSRLAREWTVERALTQPVAFIYSHQKNRTTL